MLYGGIASSELRLQRNVQSHIGSASFSATGLFSVNANLTTPAIYPISASFAGAGALIASGALSNPIGQSSVAFFGAGALVANGTLSIPSLQASFLGSGNALLSSGLLGGNGTSVFTQTLGSEAPGSGYSLRIICASLSAGGSQISVKFSAGITTGKTLNNASIGIQDTTYNTVSAPIELKFGGKSGFSIGADATIWSDWADLATTLGQNVIVIEDYSGGTTYSKYAGSGGLRYYKASTASWNESAPSGSWSTDNYSLDVLEIDVR